MKKILPLIWAALILSTKISHCIGLGTSINPSGDTEKEKLTIETLSKKITAEMSSIKTYAFTIHQNTYIAGSTQTVIADIKFMRPDKLYIRYRQPQVQEVIFNQGVLYTYIPEIRQATRQKRDNIEEILGITPSIIISSEPFKLLKNNFKLSIRDSDVSDNAILIEAVPIKRNDFEKIDIFFNPDTYLLEKTVFIARNFKSVTNFTGYKINFDIEEDYFNFSPGKKVNIIEID